MIERVTGLYFSPCGNVEKAVRAMAEGAAERLGVPAVMADITLPAARRGEYVFGPGELVIVGTPVYAGRVPNKLTPYIAAHIRGSGPAAAVVCFGNRSFDDALGELYGILTKNGFAVMGAAALASEHSFTRLLAPDRPTPEELARARAFAAMVGERAASGVEPLPAGAIPGQTEPTAYYTPLGTDGRPANFLRAVPAVDRARCVGCGVCAGACPMGSIDSADPAKMNGICIKCHACIHKCPHQARSFADPAFLSHRTMLETHYRRPAESVFIPAAL